MLIGGALVAAGMVISYYGAQLVTSDLAITEGVVSQGSPVDITKELDPSVTAAGVYVIRVENFEGSLSATLFDPSGLALASKEVTTKSTEEEFEIGIKGDYRLLLENPGTGEALVVIGLTHMPDKNFIALNLFGQSIIISGFVGLGFAIIYEIKSRRRKVS